jgi:hypothetical protein
MPFIPPLNLPSSPDGNRSHEEIKNDDSSFSSSKLSSSTNKKRLIPREPSHKSSNHGKGPSNASSMTIDKSI